MAKKCQNCGTVNTNGAKKCSGCGSPFLVQKFRDVSRKIKDRI